MNDRECSNALDNKWPGCGTGFQARFGRIRDLCKAVKWTMELSIRIKQTLCNET